MIHVTHVTKLRTNACDWKGWTPAGLELLARVLRKAKAHAALAERARADDATIAEQIRQHEAAAGISWTTPEVSP